jgi:hypothetical protein
MDVSFRRHSNPTVRHGINLSKEQSADTLPSMNVDFQCPRNHSRPFFPTILNPQFTIRYLLFAFPFPPNCDPPCPYPTLSVIIPVYFTQIEIALHPIDQDML